MRAAAVDVLLPCLDEAQALPGVLALVPAAWRVIVIDNGSTDGTAEVARAAGATVVREPVRGFGSACAAGLAAATAPVVAYLDADGSLDPRQLHRVVDPVLRGDADLVLGARHPSRGAWPLHARVANRALARRLRAAGVPVTDLGPMRAARREDLLALGIHDRRSGWPLEMVLRAAAAGWRVREVSVDYAPRAGGRSKVTGTARGTVTAVRDMRAVFAAATEAARGPAVAP